MGKNNYLSKEEQRLWEYIQDKSIVDTELVSYIFPDFTNEKRNNLLYRLQKKGHIRRAMKGIYYNAKNMDEYNSLALKLNNGYLGLASALKHHGLIEYEDFTIFVMTKDKYFTIDIENYSFRYIPMKGLFTGYVREKGINVSTIEKTLFDCFYRIKYVSYSVLSKAIYEARDVDWRKFFSYFKLAPKSLKQKVGYILEMLQDETDIELPKYIFKELDKGRKVPIKLESNNSKSVFDPKWKIQDNIGKEKILSWWY